MVQVRLPYHVRVCVPCYKEDLEILRRTILAAYDALLPAGCSRTIYLCDDGKDPRKRKWWVSLPSPLPLPTNNSSTPPLPAPSSPKMLVLAMPGVCRQFCG